MVYYGSLSSTRQQGLVLLMLTLSHLMSTSTCPGGQGCNDKSQLMTWNLTACQRSLSFSSPTLSNLLPTGTTHFLPQHQRQLLPVLGIICLVASGRENLPRSQDSRQLCWSGDCMQKRHTDSTHSTWTCLSLRQRSQATLFTQHTQ